MTSDWGRQAAALPVRDGQVCLVRSRGGRRWVIPKGKVGLKQSASEVALLEAWEEAGLTGLLDGEPTGSYLHVKTEGLRHVTVYVLRVEGESDAWPERGDRERRWFSAAEALDVLPEDGLRAILRGVFGPARSVSDEPSSLARAPSQYPR
jgi:8-oxo-dGTP pyrophosphatase MutT (NUDIX family)